MNLRLPQIPQIRFGVFADYDAIYSQYGGRLIYYFSLGRGSDRTDFRIWAVLGAAHWTNRCAGYLTGTGFAGMSDEAQSRLRAHPTFAASHAGADEDREIEAARWLAFNTRLTYAADSKRAMQQADLDAEAVKRISSATHESIYDYFRACYDDRKLCEPGITVCAGIHEITAEFLRRNGVKAMAVNVNASGMMHVITAALTDSRSMLIDYGNLYQTEGRKLDELLRYYSVYVGKPLFWSQMFDGEGYIGTYEAPEGILLLRTSGNSAPDIIPKEVWGASR